MSAAEEVLQHHMTLEKQRIQVGIGLFERTHELLFGNPRITAVFRHMGSLLVVVRDPQSRLRAPSSPLRDLDETKGGFTARTVRVEAIGVDRQPSYLSARKGQVLRVGQDLSIGGPVSGNRSLARQTDPSRYAPSSIA